MCRLWFKLQSQKHIRTENNKTSKYDSSGILNIERE